MVAVRNIRDYRANQAAFCNRRASVYGQISRPCKVAAAADSVHYVFAHNVRAVYIAGQVNFNGRIHRNYAYPTRNFGAVRNFLRAQDELVLEEFYVLIDFVYFSRRACERCRRSALDVPVLDKVNHGVLQDFRIHAELRNVGVFTQSSQNRICDISYAALDWEKLRGNSAGLHFRREEVRDILADFLSDRVRGLKGRNLVGHVGMDNAGYLFGIDLYNRRTDSVASGIYRYFAAERRVSRFIDVVDSVQLLGLVGIELYQYFVCKLQSRGGDAD